MKQKDTRMKLINEILAGIKVAHSLLYFLSDVSLEFKDGYISQEHTCKFTTIATVVITEECLFLLKVLKMYAWEPPFSQKVQAVRKRELQCVQKQNYISMINGACFLSASYFVSFMFVELA